MTINTPPPHKKLIAFLPILIPVMIFFILNSLTPVFWDDFIRACFFTDWYAPQKEILHSFSDVITSVYNMYHVKEGRIVANFFQFFFMFLQNKHIFNICNTLVFFAFIILMSFHITGSFKKIRPKLFMFISILLWFEVAAWGQNFLWLTGSISYLWTSTTILLFLIPYRKRIDTLSYKPHITLSFLWLFIGIIAGCSMENSAAAVLLLLLAYFVFLIFNKQKVFLFEIIGFIGFLAGFIILINSRGSIFPGFIGLIKNAIQVGSLFLVNNLFLLGAIIFLAIELIKVKKIPLPKTAYGFFLAAIGSAAAMIIPGNYGGRSEFITKVFLIITLFILFMLIKKHFEKRIIKACGILVICLFISSLYTATISIVTSFFYNEARNRYIISEVQKGNKNIKAKAPVNINDRHNGMHNGHDILYYEWADSKPYIAHNTAKAAWYGIESIDGIIPERKGSLSGSLKEFLSRRKQENLNINDFFIIIYDNW